MTQRKEEGKQEKQPTKARNQTGGRKDRRKKSCVSMDRQTASPLCPVWLAVLQTPPEPSSMGPEYSAWTLSTPAAPSSDCT